MTCANTDVFMIQGGSINILRQVKKTASLLLTMVNSNAEWNVDTSIETDEICLSCSTSSDETRLIKISRRNCGTDGIFYADTTKDIVQLLKNLVKVVDKEIKSYEDKAIAFLEILDVVPIGHVRVTSIVFSMQIGTFRFTARYNGDAFVLFNYERTESCYYRPGADNKQHAVNFLIGE